jgi:hypothetical protein
MSTPDPICEAEWQALIKQAQKAGFIIRFNHGGVAVILRELEPDPPPPPKSSV